MCSSAGDGEGGRSVAPKSVEVALYEVGLGCRVYVMERPGPVTFLSPVGHSFHLVTTPDIRTEPIGDLRAFLSGLLPEGERLQNPEYGFVNL